MRVDDATTVVVTGGTGFLGRQSRPSCARPALRSRARHQDYDLRDREATARCCGSFGRTPSSTSRRPSAGSVPTASPAASSTRTRSWASSSSRPAASPGGEALVSGTVCAYPKYTPLPFQEDDLGTAIPRRRTRRTASRRRHCSRSPGLPRAVRDERHLPAAGQPLRPGRQLRPRPGHVIPAMIRKLPDRHRRRKTS